jgi:hypothetical protein
MFDIKNDIIVNYLEQIVYKIFYFQLIGLNEYQLKRMSQYHPFQPTTKSFDVVIITSLLVTATYLESNSIFFL